MMNLLMQNLNLYLLFDFKQVDLVVAVVMVEVAAEVDRVMAEAWVVEKWVEMVAAMVGVWQDTEAVHQEVVVV